MNLSLPSHPKVELAERWRAKLKKRIIEELRR
jgi:hypothetical protein